MRFICEITALPHGFNKKGKAGPPSRIELIDVRDEDVFIVKVELPVTNFNQVDESAKDFIAGELTKAKVALIMGPFGYRFDVKEREYNPDLDDREPLIPLAKFNGQELARHITESIVKQDPNPRYFALAVLRSGQCTR